MRERLQALRVLGAGTTDDAGGQPDDDRQRELAPCM